MSIGDHEARLHELLGIFARQVVRFRSSKRVFFLGQAGFLFGVVLIHSHNRTTGGHFPSQMMTLYLFIRFCPNDTSGARHAPVEPGTHLDIIPGADPVALNPSNGSGDNARRGERLLRAEGTAAGASAPKRRRVDRRVRRLVEFPGSQPGYEVLHGR